MSAVFTVFVCSTFADLTSEREAVLDAIRRLKLQHDSMEFFGARTSQPLETCLQEVRASDILVVIVGHRYGTIAPGRDISFSQAEYEEGYGLSKPCLIYMRDENVAVLPRHVERDPTAMRLLDQWKSTLQLRHTVCTFQDGKGLAVQVAADLARTIHDLEEVARERSAERGPSGPNLLEEVSAIVTSAVQQGAPEPSLLSTIRSAVASLVSTLNKRPPKVFLSYAREDAERVDAVAAGLAEAGIEVWLDKTDLRPGQNWMREIERELSTADFVIFFISRASVASSWVNKELQIALHRRLSGEGGAAILPVILEDTDVPPLLRQYHWIDLRTGGLERGIEQLVDAMRRWSEERR